MSFINKTNEIWISFKDYERLIDYFDSFKNIEGGAFLLAGVNDSEKRMVFLVKKVKLATKENIKTHSQVYLELETIFLSEILKESRESKLSLISIHNHLYSNSVSFSSVDDINDMEHFLYISQNIPNANFANIVISKKDKELRFRGRLWSKKFGCPLPIDKIKIIGSPMSEVFSESYRIMLDAYSRLSSQGILRSSEFEEIEKYDRQIRALGKEFQKVLSKVSVGIVGLGGVGSIVATYMAHSGVGQLTLIDYDSVEFSNLNRLLGSKPDDAKNSTSKVEIIKKRLIEINPEIEIIPIKSSVKEMESINSLKTADVIIGCVDNDFTRMILNQLSIQYLIPYLDCGAGITLDEKSKINQMGCQLRVVLPDGPCLSCYNGLDKENIIQGLLANEEKVLREETGYGLGKSEPAPAVIFLNSIVASLAIQEFLNIYSEFKKHSSYIYYDCLNSRILNLNFEKNKECPFCGENSSAKVGDIEPIIFQESLALNLPKVK